MASNHTTLFLVAAVGVGLYWVMKKSKSATDAASNLIAAPFVAWVNANPIQAAGSIIFPGNIAVPLTQLKPYTSGVATLVTYGGRVYRLGVRNADNNWPATLVG